MKIFSSQLDAHLNHQLSAIYLVSGDEHLLLQEALTSICDKAKDSGYSEKEIFHVETSFNWEKFVGAFSNLSLFNNNTILELRINSKISDEGSKIIQKYVSTPPVNKILILVMGKLDANIQKTAWFKAIDSKGIIIQIWPIERGEIASWILQRMRKIGLNTDTNGAKLLAEHSIGNLLALSQDIEKLRLIYGEKFLTVDEIISAISDNSKYTVFNLVDAWLVKDVKLALKIIDSFKNDNTEPTIILWSIVRELRTLIAIAEAIANGATTDSAMQKYFVWNNRKILIKTALRNYNLDHLKQLLKKSTELDLIIKGAVSGNFWIGLEKLITIPVRDIRIF